MDNQTFFTILLSMLFAVGSGVAIYAMSISLIEPRLAKRGVAVAWGAGIILCVWYGATNDMERTWRYAIAAAIAAALTVAACVALDYVRDREARSGAADAATPTAGQLQLGELRRLGDFVGKDETPLRQLFDIYGVLAKNIEVQVIRINYRKAGQSNMFQYNHYAEGDGSFIMLALPGKYHMTPSGPHVDEGPRDVLFLITTKKYQKAYADLLGFLNSALVPQSVKSTISDLKEIVDKDMEIMTKTLNASMNKDEDLFLSAEESGNPNYKVVYNDYVTAFLPLKPAASDVLTEIGRHLQTN
jgi:hypothetical protein